MVQRRRWYKTRMEIIRGFQGKACGPDCSGKWLNAPIGVLTNDDIQVEEFRAAITNLLEKGHGKYRNLMIMGPHYAKLREKVNTRSEV